ncbi:prepilin-type N-terminal cleavage/methylation domain-containing protein [Solibacillus sp. FSL W7-1324]|uniref:prepilin-type N-terminal cleavage/methylation domain-containing protein n=1 Tax=Solibacillus sp. FSL W7-1324 TaxID=2921701 RepID=UPI0030F5E75D
MFNTLKKRIKNEKGLSLVELLAVIVILAIVAAIAIPAIGNIIENSRYNAVKSDAINVLNAAQLYYTDNPGGEAAEGSSVGAATTTSITVGQLITGKYLETAGKIPEGATVASSQPYKLTATVQNAVGSKTVTFTNATLTQITADKQKGSATTINAIGTASNQ